MSEYSSRVVWQYDTYANVVALVGRPMNPEFDFVAAHVGTNAAELMERLDLFRDGYRSLALSGRAQTHTCSRPSLWSTNRGNYQLIKNLE